ncbi:MAG: RnfABCDGE type electron transport complex subunit D [Elusimicrobia bacterium]|nr:RnfABCDGE type electron transport complex subunit D [Elusimicrobiota bacterium]
MKFAISPSPHIKSKETTLKIMLSVFIALLPAGILGVYRFGIHTAYVILTSIISCVLIEFISQKFIFKTNIKITNGSAALTGLLMAYCLPPDIALWKVMVGSFFAIFITKECFGGLGFNIFNPALIGRAVLLTSFPNAMTKWQVDGITRASPLGILKEKLTDQLPSYMDLFMGNIPGSLGEVSKFLLILGVIFLFYRRIITWHIPFTYIGTVALLSFLFKQDPVFQILSGGLVLGAFFMATDYVTSPMFIKGKIVFGFGCGILTVLIRNLGAYPEGVCYSILIMNILVPLIDRYTKPRVFGT